MARNLRLTYTTNEGIVYKSRSRHIAFLIAALLLSAVVAGLGGVSVARKASTFQPLGFTARAAGGGWQVTGVTHPETGLHDGDTVLLVQGHEVTRAGALAGELRARGRSQLVVARGGELVTVTYSRPPLDVDLPYLILALIGVAYLLIGFYTALKSRGAHDEDPRAGRLFFLWCAASATFYLVTDAGSYDAVGKVLFVADMTARLLLPPLTVHLFLVFPELLARSATARRRLRRVLPFLYLPAAFLLFVQANLIVGGGGLLGATRALQRGRLELLDRLEVLHLALYAVAAVALLVVRFTRARDWEQRRQLRWMTTGVAAGYLPFLAFYVAPLAIGVPLSEAATAGAVLPLVLVPLTFAWAILRYRLWDIEVMVRDAMSYTLTLLLGVIGFSVANLLISRGLPADVPLLRNVLVFLAGLAIAGVLVPAKRSISSGLERLQYRGSYGKRRALAAFGRDLLRERDLARLCRKLLTAVEDAVDVERANLYLAQGDMLAPVRPDDAVPETLHPDALGDGFWDEDVRRLGGVHLPTAATLPAQRLYAAGYRYALPLTVHGNPVALALTGWKDDQERLTSDDVALLRQLLDRAALAIENAQLVDQLQHRLDEVSQLQKYSEGIIESSPAGIAVVDGDGRIVSANAGFAEVVGVERDALTGRSLEEVLPIRPLPEAGAGPQEVSYCTGLGDDDRTEHHLQVSTAQFDRRSGGRILVLHDVTERVVMEAALKERDRLAALGIMAAGVAHEVNTPLTGISSYAQMLLSETPEDDPRHSVLQKVERQTFRAAKIVNGLLDFARNRSGEMGPVDLAAVVDECLELLRERLSKRSIRVEWTGAEPVVEVHGESGELQQVVTNLLLNACDAMEETGGGTLTLELQRVDTDGGSRARLTVTDTGVGIATDQLERIFEPFVTTKLGRGGTGLGLAISSDIVQHHGGELTVRSQPGEGATFTLELPVEERSG